MHLPIINTPQQALALAQQHDDFFYLAAFKLQVWLSTLSIQALAEYAEKPDPAARTMQTGQAWQAFQHHFGQANDKQLPLIASCLTRFSECENPIAKTLLCAMVPIYVEHDLSGDFLGPKAPDLSHRPREFALLIRRSVQRMCDWLDAVIHLNTHVMWFREPSCFDPDPHKRRLACRDVSQQYVAQMADPLLSPYLPQSPTSRPPGLGQPAPDFGTAAPASERPWPFPQLDQALIALWPLLKLHNWTYADLWNVLRLAQIPLAGSPCQNHRRLAAYCFHSLGLRKTGHGQTCRDSKPPGLALALRLLAVRPRQPAPGQAPWS